MSDATTVRRDRTQKLCRILSAHVSGATSEGLGNWDEAWSLVEEPSARFLDPLNEFERTGEEQHMDRAKTLAIGVRDAWREADRRYRKAGRREEREVTA